MSDVIAAVATGHHPCAIGILRLSGDGCCDVAEKVFSLNSGISLARAECGKLSLGRLYDINGRVIDHAMFVHSKAPHSYTGEDTAEIQCHGSPAVLAAGLEALFHAGARAAKPGEFTKRAFLNGKTDLTAAEAVADLIDAETSDAAANAAGQIGGAVIKRINPIYDSLTNICSHYHAVLDYPDEEIPEFQMKDFESIIQSAKNDLTKLSETASRGRILKNGVKIALIGKPNTGKSSLMNALVGYNRVIVSDIAGTTRDTVEESVKFGNVPARIIDTAGIHEAESPIESLGVGRSLESARNADVAFFVCDGSEALTREDFDAIETAKLAAKSIGIVNKNDLQQIVNCDQLPFDAVFSVSAENGSGLNSLSEYIENTFRNDLPCDGTILTNERQADAVSRAEQALETALNSIEAGYTPDAVLSDIEAALNALGELTGKTVREDITKQIFERFCVGK